MQEKIIHYYVFFVKIRGYGLTPVYERTCGTERGAEARVNELIRRGNDAAFWTTRRCRFPFWY